MAHGDWSDKWEDVWESTPGTEALEPWEQRHVETLFETGFTLHADEYDALGLSESDVKAVREEFFDYMGLDTSDFDWDGWREAMGYE